MTIHQYPMFSVYNEIIYCFNKSIIVQCIREHKLSLPSGTCTTVNTFIISRGNFERHTLYNGNNLFHDGYQ